MTLGICDKPLVNPDGGLPRQRLLQEDGVYILPTGSGAPIKPTGENPEEERLVPYNRIEDHGGANELLLTIIRPNEETKEAVSASVTNVRMTEKEEGEEYGCSGKLGRWRSDEEFGEGDAKRKKNSRGCFQRYRDLIAYWWLGFCNNFTYWVMITAAFDMLAPEFQGHSQEETSDTFLQGGNITSDEDLGVEKSNTGSRFSPVVADTRWKNESSYIIVNTFECQEHSTGAILVADTLPATALTLAAPLMLLLSVNIRVFLVCFLCGASYLTLGLAHSKFVFVGVALASASRGFSDSTFLGHSSLYSKSVLSMWSSGTGVATFVGPLLYSCLTTGGMDPWQALLVFLAVPIVTAVSFWGLLRRIEDVGGKGDLEKEEDDEGLRSNHNKVIEKQKMSNRIQKKLTLFMRAQRYIFPLSSFYFIMYLTNQGLLELVYFPTSVLTHAQQYSWSNTVRCLGTLISRSAHTAMLFPSGWIYNVIAIVILGLMGSEAYYHYMPSEYIVFALLLIQGLTEGAAFRTCVFKIHNKASEEDRSFCLGVFPSSLFLPALIAGLASMPIHGLLCKHHAFKA